MRIHVEGGFERETLPERFAKKINFTDSCWVWKAYKVKGGYGKYVVGKIQFQAHRFSWEYFNGHIAKGMCVLHRCDNPSCVNPSHLFIGTHQENMDDRGNKDRTAKGENNGQSKLKEWEITEIRRDCKKGTKGEFSTSVYAKKFNVTQRHITNILERKYR